MKPPDRDPAGNGCGTDVAAYALGALEPDEARALEQHLRTCMVCRDELGALRSVTETLPLATPQRRAPRSLKRRLMSEVREHPASARQGRAHRGAGRVRPVVALAGALAVAAAVGIGVIVASSGSSAPRLIQAKVTSPGANALLRVSGQQTALIVRRMPQPPAGKIYEVWLKRGSAAPSPTDALFGVTAGGGATVAVPGDLRGVTAVLVTPEPRGGSLAPTHAPVIVAQL